MSSNEEPGRQRILDPFLFPSETDARFALFIAAVLLLSFNLGWNLAAQFFPFDFQAYPSLDINLVDPAAVGQGLREWTSHLALALRFLAFPLGWMGLVLLLAGLIYSRHAARIRRQKKLHPLQRADDPHFVDAVHKLADLTGISPAPVIEMEMGSRSVDGQAFGFRPRYMLRLGGRLRLLLRKNPAYFRAIVLHELAHIANADITRTYFAQAVWSATVLLVGIPALAIIFFRFISTLVELTADPSPASLQRLVMLSLPTLFILFFQFIATLALVAAIRASLLRAREIYADLRALRWGAQSSLMDILRRHNSSRNSSAGPWKLHPTAAERLAVLEDPARLSRLPVGVSFFTGALLGLGTAGATILIQSLSYAILSAGIAGILFFARFLPDPTLLSGSVLAAELAALAAAGALAAGSGFLLAYLMASTVGVEIQRQAVADLVNQRRGWWLYLQLWRPAALAALGFQLGILLTPESVLAMLPYLFLDLPALAVSVALVLIFTATTAFLFWLWLVHARFSSMRFLRSSSSGTSLQRKRRLLTLFQAMLLLILLIPPVVGFFVMDQVVVAMYETTLEFLQVFVGAFLVVGVIYLVMLGLTGLVLFIYQQIRTAPCPACSTALPDYTLGQNCSRCGQEPTAAFFIA